MRRIMIMLAALLSALAFSAGPANAGPGDLEMYGLTGLNPSAGTQFVPEASIPATCTAVDVNQIPSGEVWSARNLTSQTPVAFFTSLSNCTNNVRLLTLQPGQVNSAFVNAATYIKAVPR